jgi:hypothetical protein
MTGAGLFPGDIAVVDRWLTPWSGCIVLALIEGVGVGHLDYPVLIGG